MQLAVSSSLVSSTRARLTATADACEPHTDPISDWRHRTACTMNLHTYTTHEATHNTRATVVQYLLLALRIAELANFYSSVCTQKLLCQIAMLLLYALISSPRMVIKKQ